MKSSPSTSTKKAVTLSLHGDVPDEARAHRITLSAVLESAARYAIRPARQRRRREEHRPAIAAYHAQIAQHRVFSDGVRSF